MKYIPVAKKHLHSFCQTLLEMYVHTIIIVHNQSIFFCIIFVQLALLIVMLYVDTKIYIASTCL